MLLSQNIYLGTQILEYNSGTRLMQSARPWGTTPMKLQKKIVLLHYLPQSTLEAVSTPVYMLYDIV